MALSPLIDEMNVRHVFQIPIHFVSHEKHQLQRAKLVEAVKKQLL